MKDFVAELLFHFFIMMIIPLANNLLYRQSREGMRNIVFLLIIIGSLLLSMLYPVRIADGLEFDLKFIPAFIAFFYLNPIAGILSIAVLLGVNAIIDIHSLFPMIINYSIAIGLFFLINKPFQKSGLLFKLCVGGAFYFMILGTRMIALVQSGQFNDIESLLWFSLVSMASLSMTIYLIEMNNMHYIMAERLKNADKLNAISQLAASIAHEIRNPMTTIRGFLQLIKNEKNLTASQGTFISLSLEELDRTHHIITDFLSLARPSTQSTELISLTEITYAIVDFMRPYAVFSKVYLSADIQEELFISGNVNEFKQLMINLIKNGIEAMPDGGNIEIKGYKKNSMAVIEVNDHGIGIPPHQIKQLGQPYYSTKSKGTGLGLMICFDIIKRMKGDYEINSIAQQGTSFKISFPRINNND